MLPTPESADDHKAFDSASNVTESVWESEYCGKLAPQLASDAPVFKLAGPEVEWYHGMLIPFVHYVPVCKKCTQTNLNDMLLWANEHRYAVSTIVKQANEFAQLYFTQNARECYGLQLFHRLHKLGYGNFTLPFSAVDVSNCSSLLTCPQLQSSQ